MKPEERKGLAVASEEESAEVNKCWSIGVDDGGKELVAEDDATMATIKLTHKTVK
uniref:Uncharacterized protein n=1 Tax=Peronospora matthiolae TaxID=2874970 RepID=A0AAV1TFP8_9STRA